MNIDKELLYRFELGLNPGDLQGSGTHATVLGYGEISCIFQIDENTEVAYKRMPLFSSLPSAERYVQKYREYCQLLARAGLKLPENETVIIHAPEHPVVCYIAYKK